MLSKASSGSLPADSLCLDLEDSVAPGKKADARKNILKALNDIDAAGNKLKSEIVVRINPFGSGFEDDDLRVVFAGKRAPDAIAIPKVEHADQVKWLSSLLNFLTGDKERSSGQFTRIIAMIENPHGLIHLPSIVNTAPHRLVALIFGADDFAASIGASRASASMTEQSKQANDFNGTPLFRPNEEVSWARQSVVMHAKSANLQCIDVVQINYHDEALLVRECREGAALGYTGKQIIHPKQIAPTEQYFAPSADRISWAKRLVAAYDHNIAAGKGAFEFEGQMIDLPTVKIAQTIMRRAQSCGLA